MKRLYIQSIASLAIALPLAIALIAFLIIIVVKSSLLADFDKNKKTYEQELVLNQQITQLEKKSADSKEKLAQWNALLEGNGYTKFNNNLRDAVKASNQSKQLLITEQSQTQAKSLGVDSKHSSCDFTLQGTFTDLQHCLLNLEAKMPNLMVDRMELKPNSQGRLISLSINCTTWEK